MERKRVLVADDSDSYGALLSRYLSSQPDVDVVGLANDGSEAVRLASMLHPDLVVMDLCMPGMDGFEATRALREAEPAVKVIALTAYGAGDSERRSIEAGAAAFLPKAEVDRKLIELIRRLGARSGESDLTEQSTDC